MPAPALMTMAMPAIAAKAANRLPLTPQRRREKPRRAKLPMPDRNAMLSASRDQSPAAVSRYPVNKIGKIRGFLANFADSKAGGGAGLFVDFDPTPISTSPPPGSPS